MGHTSDAKSKNQKSPYDREPYTDRHAHKFASLAYHHAKQRGVLTDEDVLKSLKDEKEFNDSLKNNA